MSKARRLGIGLGSGLLVAVAAVYLGFAYVAPHARTGGPLLPDSKTNLNLPSAGGSPQTWGIPFEPTFAYPIRIESVEPVGVDGLDILAVKITRIGIHGEGSLALDRGWPPQHVTLQDVQDPAGAVLPPASQADHGIQIVIAMARSSGAATGTIAGVRVRYAADGVEYDDVLPLSLELGNASPSTSASP